MPQSIKCESIDKQDSMALQKSKRRGQAACLRCVYGQPDIFSSMRCSRCSRYDAACNLRPGKDYALLFVRVDTEKLLLSRGHTRRNQLL